MLFVNRTKLKTALIETALTGESLYLSDIYVVAIKSKQDLFFFNSTLTEVEQLWKLDVLRDPKGPGGPGHLVFIAFFGNGQPKSFQ